MHEINRDNAAEYLEASGRIHSDELVEIRELSGGVSNMVLLVRLPARGAAFVLKQARGRLRVKEEWLCPVERIWREVEVLRICGELLQVRNAQCETRRAAITASVPSVLWEDRPNYAYA